jgi:hypothetical protein
VATGLGNAATAAAGQSPALDERPRGKRGVLALLVKKNQGMGGERGVRRRWCPF